MTRLDKGVDTLRSTALWDTGGWYEE
jgi:hypothetical protein